MTRGRWGGVLLPHLPAYPEGGIVAHISHRLGPFNGQVGPVVFRNGEAETDDEDMVLYFLDDPDTYDVTTDSDADPDTDSDSDED